MIKSIIVLVTAIVATASLSAKECVYEYDQKNTSLEWTAFKFTEKAGVKGKLKTFVVTGTEKVKTPVELLNAAFTINTSSVDSGNKERDPKIIEFFFGQLAGGQQISGKFLSYKGTDAGKVLVELTMNGKTRKVPMNFTVTGPTINVTGTLNLNKWDAGKALKSLNTKCFDLHKGKDGKSKLWSEVDITIISKAIETCK